MLCSTFREPRHAALVVAVVAALTCVDLAAETLDEIVVTADLRERAAADLSPSVTVVDGDTIDATTVQHFEELIAAIPNLNWSGDGNRARYLQIRGIGELEQYEGAPNPSVGFLVDDIDFSGIGAIATLFDVQQVEVLRGPQGTRYGANALAGLIYVRSNDPGDTWSGHAKLSAGGDDLRSGGIAAGGPLSADGTLRLRLAAHHHASNGFRDNAYLGRDDTNGRDETTLRGKLAWDAGDNWTLRLSALYANVDDGYDAFAIDNSLTVLSDRPGRDAQQSLGGALRAEWQGSDVYRLTSITTYADSDIDFSFDADWGNPDAWAPYTYDFISDNQRRRRTLSQEIRLRSAQDGQLFDGRAAWLLGAWVSRMNDDLVTRNAGDYEDPFFAFSLSIDDRFASDYEALTAALFGELDVDVGDAGQLTIGLRGERRSSDYADSAGLSVSPGETMAGGELRYRHRLSDATSVFTSLSRGYKAGGFNLGVVPAGRREFGAEALWSLELGVRTAWLDERLRFEAVAFHYDHRDQQVRTSFQLNPSDPASFVFFTDNAASGRTLGGEFELRYAGGDHWEWYVGGGLLRAEFDEFETPQVSLSGRDQAHAPRYSLAAGAAWRHPSGFFARVDVNARDAFYFDVSHDQRSSSYALVGARLGYEGERYGAAIWARNLADERYAVRGFYFGNEPPDFPNALYLRYGDPRQLGLTFDARF